MAVSLEGNDGSPGLGIVSNVAMIYISRGDTKAALELLEPRIPGATPFDKDYWIGLGKAREAEGEAEGAITALIEPVLLRGLNYPSEAGKQLKRV